MLKGLKFFRMQKLCTEFKTGKNLPWIVNEDTGVEPKTTDETAALIKSEAPKLVESLNKTGDPVDRLLAQAFQSDVEKRPTTREFQLRMDALIKKQLQDTLASQLPGLRTDVNSDNASEALGRENGKYIAYIETSPITGIFELKLAYRDSKNRLVITSLEANPFDPVEVEKNKNEFQKEMHLTLIRGLKVTSPDTGPKMQDIPPPLVKTNFFELPSDSDGTSESNLDTESSETSPDGSSSLSPLSRMRKPKPKETSPYESIH